MRLTLRAMLAYLDKHCDWTPAEKSDFGKRIEESKFASDLVERIRVATRRPRLGSPKVEGRGIGLDANTVAEYLEGSLPAERIADFEKLCLESDVHLAEVAACHEILSDVMAGIRPPIRFGLKETIIALGQPGGEERFRKSRALASRAAANATTGASGTGEAAPSSEQAGSILAPPVVAANGAGSAPATTTAGTAGRTGSLPWRNMALALGVAFLLVIGGLRLLGPFDHRHPLVGGGGGDDHLVAQAGTGGEEGQRSGGSSPALPSDSSGKSVGGAPRESEGDQELTSGRDSTAAAAKPAPVPGTADDRPTTDEVPESAPKTRAAGRSEGQAGETAEKAKPEPPGAGAAAPRPAVEPATPATPPQPADKGPTPGKRDPRTTPMPEPAPVEVARLVSEEQTLAEVDSRDGLWYRLVRGTPLLAGKTYVALPFYRPQLLIPNATQVMVVGPASFTLTPPAVGEMGGGVALQRGRAILATAGAPGARVPLALAGQQGSVAFEDSNAELAVEIRRYLPPGANPEEVAAQVTRLFFARRGAVRWQPEGGEPVRIPADHVLALIDGEEPVLQASVFPAWSELRNVSKLDRDAYEQLEQLLRPERPLTLSLEELQSFRKTEIRSLAARCLASLGEFEALIRELANDQQHSYWDRSVDELRDALAQGPEEAARIRDTIRRIRIEDAPILYRLLQDYSPEQLAREEGATQLVSLLDHKALDVRVLAFENLRRITGATQSYRPEWPAERRRIPQQKWREKLKEEQIVHKVAPSPPPIGERKPAAKPAEPGKP